MGGHRGPTFLRRLAVGLAVLAAFAMTAASPSPAGAADTQTSDEIGAPELDPLTPLALLNDWAPTVFGTANPAAGIVDGAVVFRGAVSGGTTGEIAVLPEGMRPPAPVYVPVSLCNAIPGRLFIGTGGEVLVSSSVDFSDAQCFTSLEGASFTLGPSTRLTLRNGWINGEYGTRPAKARVSNGTVRLTGAISLGTRPTAFILPAGMRPNRPTYVAIDLCNGFPGRLLVLANGKVKVQAADDFSTASCFASLEGATFRLNGPNPLVLDGTWTGAAFGTRPAKYATSGASVHLVGGVTGGATTLITVLPEFHRPHSRAYVRTNLCGAAPGRLIIESTGEVYADFADTFTDAQCFTSLDGVSFTP